LAENLNQFPEFGGIALALRQQAAQTAQEGQLKQAQIGKYEAEAAKARTPAQAKFSNPADQALYDQFLAESGGDAGKASRKYMEYKSGLRQREAAAGVPTSGEVKVSELDIADKLVKRYTDAPKTKLDTVKDVKTYLNLAKKGEGAALPQLKRELIKLVGDNQIAQGEVRAALGSAGIVGDTINAVNEFLTGVPTADKLDSVEKVINALEQINAESYNRGRNRAATVLKEAKLSPETQKSLIPPEYKTGKDKFVTGKVYKDAKGNRARYMGNGKWETVQ
jgi:hypothetical protein